MQRKSGAGAVVFDAVGTLIHPDPPAPAVYAEVGRKFGSRLPPAVIAARFGEAFRREEVRDLATGLRTSEARERERWRRIVAAVLDDVADPQACFEQLFDHFSRPAAWRCEDEVAATLSRLGALGFELGLGSNYDRRLRRVAGGLPALGAIRHLVISSEVGWRKPSPRFFHSLCREVGRGAEDVWYVGDDRANDYDGARAAGLKAVLFDPARKEASAEVTRIDRLGGLPGLVAEEGKGRGFGW
jgi:putative hydrolase of the HAD superfamily